jgi:hypothetical protein
MRRESQSFMAERENLKFEIRNPKQIPKNGNQGN